MKKLIALLMALCLVSGSVALAQDGGKLPAPEEVAELESAGEETPEEAEAEPQPTEAAEAEPTDEAEPEPTDEAEAEPGDTEAPEETEAIEAEPTAAPERFEVWFEEGFSLELPEGWVRYAVSDEDRANGLRYILGDGSGERTLYVQVTETGLKDLSALNDAMENTEGLSKTGELTFGGVSFVAFIDALQNASCCATLLNGSQLVFAFTPQTDSDFMLVASRLMESFKLL